MYNIFGLTYYQCGNRFIIVNPNNVKIAEFIMPDDGREDEDFNTMYSIIVLLAQLAGLIEMNLNGIRKCSMPKEMKVKTYPNEYQIFFKNIMVGAIALKKDMTNAKYVVGICLCLFSRWNKYIINNNKMYKLNKRDLRR